MGTDDNTMGGAPEDTGAKSLAEEVIVTPKGTGGGEHGGSGHGARQMDEIVDFASSGMLCDLGGSRRRMSAESECWRSWWSDCLRPGPDCWGSEPDCLRSGPNCSVSTVSGCMQS